jgi:lipid-A-disaccharide synthase
MAGKGIPLIHYVAPTVWAWRRNRARKIAAFLDHLLVVLPFEPPYFQSEGLPTTFVGHTAISAPLGDGAAFRARHGITDGTKILGLLPGSRLGEVKQHGPIFFEVARRLSEKNRALHFVVATVPPVAEFVRTAFSDLGGQVSVVGADEKADAFSSMDAALAASGTVTLELTLASTPCIAAYRMNPFTAFIVRTLSHVEAISLTNLILEKPIIPEFIQENCNAANLVPHVESVLTDPAARLRQTAAKEAIEIALTSGSELPANRAAHVISEVIEKGPRVR